jgi:alpha-methylacyl-CoA racemase
MATSTKASGPLVGTKVIEISGVGPGPFCAMMLADMGAEVVRVDRASWAAGGPDPGGVPMGVLTRGRRSIAIDLKQPRGIEVFLDMVEQADALIEPFRPGVAERLGFGPDSCRDRNPRLVYGRVTGWGQDGPLAARAGHDLNYIATAGLLSQVGRRGEPPPTLLPLVGDFAGGGMFLAFGIACGLLEATRSGQGQVIDAAVVDGAGVLLSMYYGFLANQMWSEERGTNFNTGAAYFYRVYECAGGGCVAVGAYEPQFWELFVRGVGLCPEDLPAQHDQAAWPDMQDRLATIFLTRTRDEWCELLEHSDACVSPVLTPTEAAEHPHNVARTNHVTIDGVLQPAPAPRFSRTPGAVQRAPAGPGEHSSAILEDWLGLGAEEQAELRSLGAVV